MYAEKLEKIYLNKAKLNFQDFLGKPIEYEAQIGDKCSICEADSIRLNLLKPQFRPDFQLQGYLIDRVKGNPAYKISHCGTEVLYITAISINSSLQPYRLQNTLFSSYWEDKRNELGYLFQVVKMSK